MKKDIFRISNYQYCNTFVYLPYKPHYRLLLLWQSLLLCFRNEVVILSTSTLVHCCLKHCIVAYHDHERAIGCPLFVVVWVQDTIITIYISFKPSLLF